MAIRIGTCGYSYKEWKGVLYPEKLASGHFLEHYSANFDTVEVNVTYYRLPALSVLQGMIRRTPSGFSFFIKAHQGLTHVRGREAEEVLPRFKEVLKPFLDAGKLGGVLLQFPYSFRPAPSSIRYVEDLASRLKESVVVTEFRHRDWYEEKLMDWLKGDAISLCCVDEPPLPNLPPPLAVVTGPIGYVRFHGRNRARWWGEGESRPAGMRYDYLYSRDELKEWLPRIRRMEANAGKLFVFFNNHPRGQAVVNARDFQAILNEGG